MADEQTLKMIAESPLVPPREAYRQNSYLKTYDDYVKKYRESIENPTQFWNSIADELTWTERTDTVMSGEMPNFKFFPEGYLNVCENCVDRHALHPDRKNKVALYFEGEEGNRRVLTYGQLYREVQKFANVLKDLGLNKGDVVSIYMPNLPETYVVLLACLRLGIIYNTVFAGFSAEALRERIVSSNAKAVVCSNASYRRGNVLRLKDTVDEALQGETPVKDVIVFSRVPDESTPMTAGRDHDYGDLMATAASICPPEKLEANEPGLLIFTSGTSGKPKGIVHAGGGFLLGTYAYTKYQLDIRPSDVYWNTADIGWLTAHIFVLVGGLALGVTTVLYDGAVDYPHTGRVYEIMERYQVNKLFSAPTAFRMLMKYGIETADKYDLSALELLVSVGEPLNPEAWNWLYRELGQEKVVINNTWGQTETGGTPLASMPGALSMKPGSCGVPFFGHHLDVVNKDGSPVPDGEAGYLIIRNVFPTLARDVFGDNQRYIQAYFSQMPGVYFTGDSAVRDKDGQFWVLGRVDDVINVSGHRISTMEMESSLIQHSAVVEAAVVEQPDDIKGSVPIAFVTLDKSVTASAELEQELKDKIVNDIGSFARPQRMHFVDAMPKTRSGKIIRRMLREIIRDGSVKGDVTGLEDSDILDKLISDIHAES